MAVDIGKSVKFRTLYSLAVYALSYCDIGINIIDMSHESYDNFHN
jgi:hypothetical protein